MDNELLFMSRRIAVVCRGQWLHVVAATVRTTWASRVQRQPGVPVGVTLKRLRPACTFVGFWSRREERGGIREREIRDEHRRYTTRDRAAEAGSRERPGSAVSGCRCCRDGQHSSM